jgi:uncharacterized protein (TIGR02246 family)
MRRIALTLVLFAALATPALAQRAAIERANAKFVELAAKNDAAGIAALYAKDASVLPPGAEMVQGRAAIEAFWQKTLPTVTDFKAATVEVRRLGPGYAREIGTFSFKTKDAKPQDIVGKYVVVWRRSGKDWQLFTDIWNTNK